MQTLPWRIPGIVSRSLGQAFRDVSKKISPAVVYISTVYTMESIPEQYQELFENEFFRRFFGIPRQREHQRRGLGSGFIISEKGYILTNNHVVEKAEEITVTLPDKREFEAEVIGTDPMSDVAVIKIEAKNLPTAELGDSSTAQVGDWVIAVGTPYGLSQTVTAGIISAAGRANIGIVDYEDFFQTDAAINPGNSGGPLVDIAGRVIGMNTAIFSKSGGYQGIGFAIPINMVRGIKESLIQKGRVVRGWLGVSIQPVTKDIADSFGLKTAEGVLVADITRDSPAEKAGMQRGDIIVSLDGEPVENPTVLKNLVAQKEVDSNVPLTVIRNGKKETLEVKIGELASDEQTEQSKPDSPESAPLGIQVQEMTPDIAAQLGYKQEKGVIVAGVKPGSPAAGANIQRGDLIQEINQTPVDSVKAYEKAVSKGEKFLFLVRRGENTFFTVIKTEQ
ncbi:MAG: DegQ family serine endoprotease [Desulfotignum sp.]|nr:DegQ family serine endoprotease [Desulfotignum sp.]